MVTKIEEEDEEDKDEGEVGTMMSKLFVWGNNDKRQLGISLDQTEESNQDEVASAGTGTGTGPNSSTTTTQDIKCPHQLDPDPFEENEDGQIPLYIAAGYNYSGIVTTDGIIYTWGNGEFGRLGYIDVRRQPVPR